MKFILGLVVLLLATTGFAAEVSVANRADVTTKFTGHVHSVGIAIEKSAAMVSLMDSKCHPYYPVTELETNDQGETVYPHPKKPGDDCMKSAMMINLDMKADGDKMLYDFFSHAHGSVTVVTTNGKIAFVRTEAGHHGCGGSCGGPVMPIKPHPVP